MAAKRSDTGTDEHDKLKLLFRHHLQEHHHVVLKEDVEQELIREHLEGRQTLIPISIFSNKRLSALESIVKYLRENEGMSNADAAQVIGRSQAAVWITYRNASAKLGRRLRIETSDISIPTEVIASGRLSVLESISMHLHQKYCLSYRKIGELLNRDERTIWTVCSRARNKGVEAR